MGWKEKNSQQIAEAHAVRRTMWLELLRSKTLRAIITPDWLGQPATAAVERHQPSEARRASPKDIYEWAAIVAAVQSDSGPPSDKLASRCARLDQDDRLALLAIKMIGGRGRVPRRAERAQREWMELREAIVESNKKLIEQIARRCAPPGLSLEDAIDAGRRGATKAVDRFDESRGASFSKVAALWVRHEVTRRDGSRKKIPLIVPLQDLGVSATDTGGSNRLDDYNVTQFRPKFSVHEATQGAYNLSLGHEVPMHARVVLGEVLLTLPARTRRALLSMHELRPGKELQGVLATLRSKLEARGIYCVDDLLEARVGGALEG